MVGRRVPSPPRAPEVIAARNGVHALPDGQCGSKTPRDFLSSSLSIQPPTFDTGANQVLNDGEIFIFFRYLSLSLARRRP